jgi:hypothetical protein
MKISFVNQLTSGKGISTTDISYVTGLKSKSKLRNCIYKKKLTAGKGYCVLSFSLMKISFVNNIFVL